MAEIKTLGTIMQEQQKALVPEPEVFEEKLAKAPSIPDLQSMFPDIKPTDCELLEGYCLALKLAYYRQAKEAKELAKKQAREARMNISLEDFRKEVKARCIWFGEKENFEFYFDQYNKPVFDLLCLFFTNNAAFEQYKDINGNNYSLKKGILLQSPGRGTGKSILLRAFCYNPRSSFYYTHISTLRNHLMFNREREFEKALRLNDAPVVPEYFYHEKFGMMYDELFGEENKTMSMGSNVSASAMIIDALYDQQKGMDWFWKFHATANYDGQMIEDKFGVTYRSRIDEMYNFIKLEGPDRRRKK